MFGGLSFCPVPGIYKVMDAKTKFETLYRTRYDDVFYFVLRRIGSGGDSVARAEEVTAEAFTAIWCNLDKVPDHPDEAKAWLFGVARNCLLHEQRSSLRRAALAVKVTGDAAGPGIAPDDQAVHNLDFNRAWHQLTATDQEALALAAFEDLPASQAAKVLGINAGAYKFRLHSARKKLHKLLNQE